MKKKLLLFTTIFLIILLLFSGFYWFYSVRFLAGRASIKISAFSPENSYIFTNPLQARADGKEKIRITVFLLDDRGLGVANQKVKIDFHEKLNIEVVQSITDITGKAIFEVSTLKPGDYYLKIRASSRTLPQKVHLKFIP